MKGGPESVIQVNVAVMGHVDCGKTSLLRALDERLKESSVLSTASLDKHPQSRSRGITIDLGFSSLRVPLSGREFIQICFVDCPGHASLVKMIVGAAHIVDRVLLVVDATKGMQAQTIEALVISEILCPKLIVVINKIDLVPEQSREKRLNFIEKRFRASVLEGGRFHFEKSESVPFVAVSTTDPHHHGILELINELKKSFENDLPKRNSMGPLIFLFDHSFQKKGFGTVFTGTVVSGCLHVGDKVALSISEGKVKSIQSFKSETNQLGQGDRGGVAVAFESSYPTHLERGVLLTPQALDPSSPFFIPTLSAFVAVVERVRHHTRPIKNKKVFCLAIAHTTVNGTFRYLRRTEDHSTNKEFEAPVSSLTLSVSSSISSNPFDHRVEYEELKELDDGPAYALVTLSHPTTVPLGSLFLALESDCGQGRELASGPSRANLSSCRIALRGEIVAQLVSATRGEQEQFPTPFCQQIRVDRLNISKRPKMKTGMVERLSDASTLIGHKAGFASDSHVESFVGSQVLLKIMKDASCEGTLSRPFGKSGKFVVSFSQSFEEMTPGPKPGDELIIIKQKKK